MTAEIGFCSKCHIVRQDDDFGPVTPCACFVEHHASDCRLRIVIRSVFSFRCEPHGQEECFVCYACSCGVPAERTFQCSELVFGWESEVGLVPLREEKRGA